MKTKCGHCGKEIDASCPRPIDPTYLCKDCAPLYEEQFNEFIGEQVESGLKAMHWSSSAYKRLFKKRDEK